MSLYDDLAHAFRLVEQQPHRVDPPPVLTAAARARLAAAARANPHLQSALDAYQARAEAQATEQ